MNDVVTLKSLSALAIEHEADFEIFHGETTHKDKRVRAQMVLSLTGCPDVRVSFGDAKHGQRVSSITLAGNSKITVKQENLLAVLENHRTSADWRRVMTRETPLFNITPAENNLISITGKITKRLSSETVISGGTSETVDEFEVRIANHVMDARYLNLSALSEGKGLFETDPTIFYVKVPNVTNPDFRELWEEGLEDVELVGEYVFPNTLKLHHIK